MRLSATTPVLLSLAATVLAQGSIGGYQSSCNPSQNWVYLGCYADTQNGRHAGFTWQLSNIIGNERYYPGFTGLMTIDIYLRACRGHGFQYAAIYYGKECFCATTFPNPGPPASGTTTKGIGAFEGTKPGTPGGVCSVACNGNIMQICGGHSAASLYEDPSFTNSTTVQAASNYGYLGCFSYLNPGAHICNYSNRPDGNTGATTCGCGTEIQSGLQVADYRCATVCDGVSTVAGGPSACGGNGRLSVFVNKGLLGCYTPNIPGFDALTAYLAPLSAGQLSPGLGSASSLIEGPQSPGSSTGSTKTPTTYTVFPSIISSNIPQTSISKNPNSGIGPIITSAIAGTLPYTNGIYTATTVCETTSIYVTTTQFSTIMTVSNVVTTLTLFQTITVTAVIPTTTTITYAQVPGGSTDSSGNIIIRTSTGPSQNGAGSTTGTSTATPTGSLGSFDPFASTGTVISGTGSATGTNTGTATGPSGSGTETATGPFGSGTSSATGTNTGTATGPFGSGTGSATGTNTGTVTGPSGGGTGSASGTNTGTATGPFESGTGSNTGTATGTNTGAATGPFGSGTGSNTGTATGPSGGGTGSATGTNSGTATGPFRSGTGSATGTNTGTATGPSGSGTGFATATGQPRTGTESDTGTFQADTGTGSNTGTSPGFIGTSGTASVANTIASPSPPLTTTTGTSTIISIVGTSLANTTGTLSLPSDCPTSCIVTVTATVTVSVSLIPIRKARRFF